MKKNILIEMLLYGEERLMETRDITLDEMKGKLAELGYKQDVVEFAMESYLKPNFGITEVRNYRINSDGLSRLMNYHSLVSTEKGIIIADKSINIAKKSLWIAIAVGAVSVVITLISIFKATSVSLDSKQETRFTKNNSAIFQELQRVDRRDSVLLKTLINLKGVSLTAPKPQKLTASKVHH